MVERSIKVLMDDFSVVEASFDNCLENLESILLKCEDTNLVLSSKKCNFIVQEGIVLGHRIFEKGIEVAEAKVESIEKLPSPSSMKRIRSFLGHFIFYRRFFKSLKASIKSCNAMGPLQL